MTSGCHFGCQGQSLLTVGGLARHFHVRLTLHQHADTRTEQGLVIDQGDGDGAPGVSHGRLLLRSGTSVRSNHFPRTRLAFPAPSFYGRRFGLDAGLAVAAGWLSGSERNEDRHAEVFAVGSGCQPSASQVGAFTHAGQAPAQPGRGRIRSSLLSGWGNGRGYVQGQARPLQSR